MNKFILTLLAYLLACNFAQANSEPYPWEEVCNFGDGSLCSKNVETTCKRVDSINFPQKDIPTAADKIALKNCSSENYYYGIGIPVDYVKARKCAFIEIDNGIDKDNVVQVGGSAILMMIYANGVGVKQNPDLATKLACRFEWTAPAEMDFRISHLQKLKTKAETQKFDICDDVTSGLMQGYCATIDYDISKARLDARMELLTANWSSEQKEAFAKLRKSADNYFDIRSSNEIDLAGTARVELALDEQGGLEKSFEQALERFEKGKFPAYSADDLKKNNTQLNAIYKQIMKAKIASDSWTTITKKGIRQTEQAWISYRNAWVEFGAIRYPQASADSWKAWLTKERAEQLKELLSEIEG